MGIHLSNVLIHLKTSVCEHKSTSEHPTNLPNYGVHPRANGSQREYTGQALARRQIFLWQVLQRLPLSSLKNHGSSPLC